MERLRIGVIGLGWFGEIHCETIVGVPNLELAALCTRTPERLSAMVDDAGVRGLGHPAAAERVCGERARERQLHEARETRALDDGLHGFERSLPGNRRRMHHIPGEAAAITGHLPIERPFQGRSNVAMHGPDQIEQVVPAGLARGALPESFAHVVLLRRTCVCAAQAN